MDSNIPAGLAGLNEQLARIRDKAMSTGRMRPAGDSDYDREKAAEEHERVLTQCGIAPRFRSSTFAALEERGIPPSVLPQYEEVKEYVASLDANLDEGRGLILRGGVGTMKTSMAVAVLLELIARGKRGFFITMPSLLDSISLMKQQDPEEWARFETRLRETRLLILDDFGGEYYTPWLQTKVDALIAERYNHLRSVIITTNMGGEAMRAGYFERTISRLRATCDVVTFSGPCLRPAKPETRCEAM